MGQRDERFEVFGCSLKVHGHSVVQKLGDRDVIVIVLEELDHEHLVVLINRHIIFLRQEFGDRDVIVLEEAGDRSVIEEEVGDCGLEELGHCDVVGG